MFSASATRLASASSTIARRSVGAASRRLNVAPRPSFSSPITAASSFGQLRAISTTPPSEDVEKPSHASIDEHVIPYPEDHERDPNDIGHRTIGAGVGRHTQRTLASLSMEGKVCVVTGAARGLGNLIARTFVESGSNAVAVVDLNADDARTAAKDLTDWFEQHGEAKPGEILAEGYGCDVSDETAVQRTFDDIVKRFGRIDVLVNSAGIVENFPATQYPTYKIQKLWDINVNGSFFTAREAAKHMMNTGIKGSIVLVGSMSAGIVNIPQPQTPYNASKAAVRHMASSLAVEWAKDGIRVNCLSPGYMLTSLTRTILESNPAGKELKDTWENLTPMGRMGVPEDLKGAVIFLASDASSFCTGVDLKVDGGYTLT